MYRTLSLLALAFSLLIGVGCSTSPDTPEGRADLETAARATVAEFKRTDPSLAKTFFQDSKGYAVFPTVGKGGLIVGGAYGRGVLFEGDTIVGYCDMTQGTIGAQIGGQAYSELIFFQNDQVLDSFKAGKVEFSAQATAVAAKAGAAANVNYDSGVAVFIIGEKGLMAEATVGGQSFSYTPK